MVKLLPKAGSVGVETTGANKGKPFFSVHSRTLAGYSLPPETVRFMQFPDRSRS